MTRNLSTAAAHRTVISTLAALVLATASSQAGFAQGYSDAGNWKVDPAKSKFSSGFATLSLERVEGVNSTSGSLIFISKGNVYLTGTAASNSSGLKLADTGMKDGKAVLIGTYAQSMDLCGLRCQTGGRIRLITVTFRAVDPEGKLINDMLAYGGQKQ
jgi:hypothetical protein